MKVFVSSLISSMEPYRAAAISAIASLGHEAITAESFPAGPPSPRVACLRGVRDSALVVLIMGGGYGDVQPASGLSATHEEYREAKGQRPVLAFVQDGVVREPAQAEFVREVQDWEKGHFRASFSSPEQLRDAVIRSIHQWEVSAAAAPVDAHEMLARAIALLPETGRGGMRGGAPLLHVAVVGGPKQTILRPVEIERPELIEELLQRANFGSHRVFERRRGSDNRLVDGSLILDQDSGATVLLDEQGSIRITIPIKPSGGNLPAIIGEHVSEAFMTSLGYVAEVLDHVDPVQRLSRIVVAAALTNAQAGVWRSRAEHDARPSSAAWGHSNQERVPVHLKPADRARTALSFDRERMVEDLTTLLRRQWAT
jgi:Domain of unknown function (DUF4062)